MHLLERRIYYLQKLFLTQNKTQAPLEKKMVCVFNPLSLNNFDRSLIFVKEVYLETELDLEIVGNQVT